MVVREPEFPRSRTLALARFIACVVLAFMAHGVFNHCSTRPRSPAEIAREKKHRLISSTFRRNPNLVVDGFDFPAGRPDARTYYSAQDFGDNGHLGEDWNLRGGNDLGEPVHAMAHGVVVFARDHGGGWGNVLRIVHRLPDGSYVESLYAHLDKMIVRPGDVVRRGKKIGTIGDAHGQYSPHLHLEMREDVHLPIGGGYGNPNEMAGYFAPTPFILGNRSVRMGTTILRFPIQAKPFVPSPNQIHGNAIAFVRAWKLKKLRRAIQQGADVNYRDRHGRTSLYYASAMGYTSAVRLLLARGAFSHRRDHYGYTPLMRSTFAFRRNSRLQRLLRLR